MSRCVQGTETVKKRMRQVQDHKLASNLELLRQIHQKLLSLSSSSVSLGLSSCVVVVEWFFFYLKE